MPIRPRRSSRTSVVLALVLAFLLPVAARATMFAFEGGPRRWSEADWSSIGSLPAARDYPAARVLVM
jgi:hypothetical protein